jgi:PAS domain S-box-containing protein
VWNVDDARTELILSSLIADPDVAGIAVHDEGYGLIHALGDMPESIITDEGKHAHINKLAEPAFLSDVRDLFAAVTDFRPRPHQDLVAAQEIFFETDASRELIGHLVVRFTLDNVVIATRNRLLWDGLLAAGLVLAVIVSAVVAHGRTVGTPLRRLLSAINSAKEEQVLTPVNWQSSDEIGTVVMAFNDLQKNLNEHEAALRRSRDELEEQVDERTRVLTRQEAFRRAVAETAFDCVICIDEKGQIIEFNPAAERTFGFKQSAVIGRTLSETIVPERYRLAHQEGVARYLRTGENRVIGKRIEIEAQKSDGAEIPVELSISAMTVHGAQYFTAYMRDISERKEREDELRRTKESAEKASRAKSKFLAMMSHEIRTPLNGVLGSLGLLDVSTLEGSQQKFLGVAKRSAESLLSIINDILDYSKMEAGKLDLEPSIFGISEMADDVIEVLAPRASEKGISLETHIDEAMPEFVIGDPNRVQQVLLNLTSNAVKFTNAGHVRIRASCAPAAGETYPIRFEVEDTGIGIDKRDHASLFDEFWAKATHGAKGWSSTGLGLAIAKHLVEMMSGSIGFESEKGRGSTFWFELPLQVPSDEAVRQRREQRAVREASKTDQSETGLSGRVLVAEDNPTNQLIVRAMLERMGLQVEIVADGLEAVDAIKSRRYDIVLMDIGMPEMDGVEATAAIRSLPGEIAKIPIVAMTAFAMHGDREKILAKGLDGYVGKPINREELFTTLAQWLPKASGAVIADPNRSQQSRSDSTPLFDGEVMERLIENVGRDRISRIIHTYLDELSARMDAITEAHGATNFERVAKEAHPLKSSSAEVGALRLSELAAALEAAALEGDEATLEHELTTLAAVCEATRQHIAGLVAHDPRGGRDEHA